MRHITCHAISDNGVGVMLEDTRFVALARQAAGLSVHHESAAVERSLYGDERRAMRSLSNVRSRAKK